MDFCKRGGSAEGIWLSAYGNDDVGGGGGEIKGGERPGPNREWEKRALALLVKGIARY